MARCSFLTVCLPGSGESHAFTPPVFLQSVKLMWIWRSKKEEEGKRSRVVLSPKEELSSVPERADEVMQEKERIPLPGPPWRDETELTSIESPAL